MTLISALTVAPLDHPQPFRRSAAGEQSSWLAYRRTVRKRMIPVIRASAGAAERRRAWNVEAANRFARHDLPSLPTVYPYATGMVAGPSPGALFGAYPDRGRPRWALLSSGHLIREDGPPGNDPKIMISSSAWG
jgi:hypothetical protein